MLINGFIIPPASEWLPVGSASSVEKEEISWTTDLESGLAEAKQNGQPVLIDTWATWCANCRVLEKKTFMHEKIIAESRRFKALKIQLERADTPETIAFMQKFNLKQYSLPTTLLIDSQGKVQRIMQGVVGPADMLRAMRSIH
jgi:thiol:disulfide interchange protein DsbD